MGEETLHLDSEPSHSGFIPLSGPQYAGGSLLSPYRNTHGKGIFVLQFLILSVFS